MAKPAAIKTEDQPLNSIPLAQIQTPEGMQTAVITYDYDPLYRLTEAAYTGAITATYRYDYDAVGNMTTYTETVGTETTNVSRTFDAANRLEEAQENSIPRFYGYDHNGNMTFANITDGIAEYYYNQRNMLTSQRLVGFEESTLIAEFLYDGAGNRLRQIDYADGQPTTITYTNDIVGLSQVLVANDGTTTTHNLFGLDLIHQDDGTTTRTLLADGLGSVRTEMVGDAVKTVTTYEPYGNLLAQTGTSGTTYAFIGEQHDAATGLLYLRARYFNPYIYQFQSRDPYPGYAMLPASQNGYSYSHGNPVNYTDPSGLCIEGWPGGGVRMNQYPYGTSGICPNTLGPAGWILEAHAAMDDYYNSLPGDSLPFPICSVISPCRVINMGVTVVVVSSNSQGTPVEKWRSTAADILQWGQVGLDTFELCVSAASVIVEAGATGVAIPTTGPGAIIVNRLAVMGTDAFETTIGNVDLAANVTADFVGGNSYFDRRTNEWVFGQDTAATLLEQVTDAAIPSNKADILINVVALGYDVGKATGTISDFVEYRVPPLWIGGLPFPTLADPHPLGKGYFVIYAR